MSVGRGPSATRGGWLNVLESASSCFLIACHSVAVDKKCDNFFCICCVKLSIVGVIKTTFHL